jgi:Asp-tRNA(Asn)/Glu-tRNA(Gln) amidotransferase A subunit family amidase
MAWLVHGARFDADPQAFGAEIRRRFGRGRDTPAATVRSAAAARQRDSRLIESWLEAEDTLLLPTVHCTTPALGSVDERSPPLGQFCCQCHRAIEVAATAVCGHLDSAICGYPGPTGSEHLNCQFVIAARCTRYR